MRFSRAPADALLRRVRFDGALHVYEGATPGEGVARALAHSRACGWGEAIGIGSASLPASGMTRLATLRAHYREATREVPPQLPVIYHQLAGLDLFATEDTGRHRFLWIQESFVRWSTVMGWAVRYADAFIHDEEETAEDMLGQVNWVPRKRRAVIPSATVDHTPAARATLGCFLELPIKRRFTSPRGTFNVWGFYRRQIGWIV